MRVRSVVAAVVAAASALPTLAGCEIDYAHFEVQTYPAPLKTGGTKACSGAFATPDLSTLKPCFDGKGHCYDKTKVASTDGLEVCDDATVCVPNSVLAAGGKRLKGCTSQIAGKPGVCVEVAIPEVKKNEAAIIQDICGEGEKCLPCVDPITDRANPFCDEKVGVHQDACTDTGEGGTARTTCCHLAGVCVSKDAVPGDQADQLEAQGCPENKICAPTDQVDNAPTKCDLPGGHGVCMDKCFASMLEGVSRMLRSSCRATEVCIPCLVGKGQGMRGCD